MAGDRIRLRNNISIRELEKKAKFADLHSLFHDIDTVKVVDDD